MGDYVEYNDYDFVMDMFIQELENLIMFEYFVKIILNSNGVFCYKCLFCVYVINYKSIYDCYVRKYELVCYICNVCRMLFIMFGYL